MNDVTAPAAPLAPAESFATPELAQAEYRRYAASPEFAAANASPHGKGVAMQRLEGLAAAAWPTPGQAASPTPGTPQEARKAAEAHVDGLHKQGGGGELTEAELQQLAAAYAPTSVNDFLGALPNDAHAFAAEYRQMFFDDAVSKTAVNLIASAPHFVHQALTMPDADFDAAVDKAIADTVALPGGKMMAAKALQLVKAIPEGHFYEPFALAMLTRAGGIQEIAHWSDRLRAKRAS